MSTSDSLSFLLSSAFLWRLFILSAELRLLPELASLGVSTGLGSVFFSEWEIALLSLSTSTSFLAISSFTPSTSEVTSCGTSFLGVGSKGEFSFFELNKEAGIMNLAFFFHPFLWVKLIA